MYPPLNTAIDLDAIVDWIIAEGNRRLVCENECPGGLWAKVHGVCMELDLKIIKEMQKELHHEPKL